MIRKLLAAGAGIAFVAAISLGAAHILSTPTPADAATYTCRYIDMNGRVVVTTEYTHDGNSGGHSLRVYPPGYFTWNQPRQAPTPAPTATPSVTPSPTPISDLPYCKTATLWQ